MSKQATTPTFQAVQAPREEAAVLAAPAVQAAAAAEAAVQTDLYT